MSRSGISGRIYSGGTAESVDHETGVVGKAVISIALLDITGLHKGISLECVGSLGNVVMASYLRERQYLEPVADDAAQLGELMVIVGGKYYFLHNIY